MRWSPWCRRLRGDLAAAAGGSPAIEQRPLRGTNWLDADGVIAANDVDDVPGARRTRGDRPSMAIRAAAVAALSAALEFVAGSDCATASISVSTSTRWSDELAGLRRAAVDERIRARLDLGDRELVIGELEALTVEDPLRERPWAMLMLALYRCGRQTDALRAFRQARAHLVDVGAEPGPA